MTPGHLRGAPVALPPVPLPAPVTVAVLAAVTPTTEVRRVVGEPLPSWVVIGAGLVLLALILVSGLLARRHR